MTQQQLLDNSVRAPHDAGRPNGGGGSIGLLLLMALLLVATAAGLLIMGRAKAEAWILPFLAVFAMIGVFLLFALAAGILRTSSRAAASPLIKAVVDCANEGILVTDASGRVVYANAAYMDLAQAADSKDVPPVERVFIGDPGVSEAVYRLLKAAREGRRGQEEVRVGAHKGEAGRWLRIRVRPLGDDARDARMTVWSLADVTRELERHENVFQELQHAIDYLDHAPAGFFSAEGNGSIVYLNATLANWLDYDLAQVGSGGLRLEDIVAGDGAALLTAVAAVPGDVKTEILDIELKTRTGRTIPARLFHKVAFGADGAAGASRTLVLNRSRQDGSDPQRAAEVRFTRFFQNTPMAIATVDSQGRIAESNARFARLFQPAFKGEASGDRSILAVVAERDRGALDAAIRKAADGQGEIAPVDAALVGPGERFASFFVTAIQEEGEHEREAAIVYALETTQQRTLESQLNQQQKMETIGRLAGNIAHDFNNLLSVITIATDFLLNAHKPTDPSFQDIMQIRQTSNRAATLVRQLLAFSRKQTMRPQVVSLRDSLEDLAIVVLRRLLGENIKLDVVHGRDIWPVKVDLAQFEQVIINLAVNARDAMPLGGKLTLRTSNVGAGQDTRGEYKGMPVGEYVLVEVEDTGTGIAPEIIDKIFDPFYTTKDIGKGTGLGLSTVYGIVKQTGGFIYVASEVGKGTIFRIFIPRHIPAADDAQLPELPEPTAPAIAGAMPAADETARRAATTDLTGHGTILLVEDEEGLRALNARGLQSRGYTVIEAGNGIEALDELEKQGGRVDLVVSDVVMPEMDGPTLMKELKRRNPDIKIIFVSGYAEDAFDKNLPDHGRFNFLPKPFTLRQLVTAVKETMAMGARANGA